MDANGSFKPPSIRRETSVPAWNLLSNGFRGLSSRVPLFADLVHGDSSKLFPFDLLKVQLVV